MVEIQNRKKKKNTRKRKRDAARVRFEFYGPSAETVINRSDPETMGLLLFETTTIVYRVHCVMSVRTTRRRRIDVFLFIRRI